MKASREWRVLADSEIQVVERAVISHKYRKGEVIFTEGDASPGIHFLKNGLVSIRKVRDRNISTLIRISRAGDTLGYRSVLAEQNHRSRAEVLAPTTSWFLKKSVMKSLMQTNQALGFNFLKKTATELGESHQRFHELASVRTKMRLMRLLLELHDEFGRGGTNGKLAMELPISKGDMAAMLGIRGETLSRVIRDLSEEGLVEFSGHPPATRVVFDGSLPRGAQSRH